MTEPAVETLTTVCPHCGIEVTSLWAQGCLRSPDYVLVADWVYHTACWDRLVEENLP